MAAKAKKRVSGSKRKAVKKTIRVAKGAKTVKTAATSGQEPASGASASQPAAAGGDLTGLRIRMYRVGFGDFFLLSVPTPKGPKPFRHILIDCGVHAVDLGSIQDAVAQIDRRGTIFERIASHERVAHRGGAFVLAHGRAHVVPGELAEMSGRTVPAHALDRGLEPHRREVAQLRRRFVADRDEQRVRAVRQARQARFPFRRTPGRCAQAVARRRRQGRWWWPRWPAGP